MTTRASTTCQTELSETGEPWDSPTPPNDEENPVLVKAEDGEKNDPNRVGWDGEDDTANPRNWTNGYKSWITFQLGMLALAASLGSSIIAPAEDAIAEYVGVSTEVVVLCVSLYM